ncbi:type I polyketide synthase [Xylariales sp. PMI_506]|nr:type I polyketide synthase [Xylariales sp. PMI_506]
MSVPDWTNKTDSEQPSIAAARPVAIIGMSCRFSGDVTSPCKLWDLCASGKDGWSPIPSERFETKAAKGLPAGGYFLTKEDLSLFDAAFFNFSADVASAMDPQIRLLLEAVYEATEHAGIPIEKLAGSNTSVFAGIYAKDFYDLQMRNPEMLPMSFLTGNGTAMLSNRISHFYDFQGPSVTVDTGCSSGLTAVHQACQSLYSGEADVSVVGAATTILSRDMLIAMTHQGVLGAEGKCFAWDDRAHGYGRGEGVATLILKPLDAALRDGDNVHAVIKQVGLNQDGKTTTITSPCMEAQKKLIEECYRRAGLHMSETGYVEAHMTGTAVGDPIEAEAIARTFGSSRQKGDAVMVGSVKTNIGHTEPVSGIAALIKTTYALKNAKIPPNNNYITNNPNIPVEEWNVKVPTSLIQWPKDKPLRASVNNFGYGGTNAHVILEAAPTRLDTDVQDLAAADDKDRDLIFVLSAKDSTSLQGMSQNLATYIRQSTETERDLTALTPANLAYTLSERRSRFPVVTTIRTKTLGQLAGRLEELASNSQAATKRLHGAKKPRIGFVFNGQGAQWHAMGRELIVAYPEFKASLERADQTLREYGADWSLIDELHRDEESTRVHETNISQPISVALQLCLVDLLKDWDIIPSAVTSHSSGEIAAAYSAGLLSFREALGVVYHRGELAAKYQQNLSLAGGMLAAGLGREDAEKHIEGTQGVVVACVNSPDSVTLSGDLVALDEVAAKLENQSIFARKLKVPLAYHSHHMQHMAQEYTEKLRSILTQTGASEKSWSGPIFSSPVTGDVVADPKAALTPEHWVRNLTSPVLFATAFENMCYSGPKPTDRNVDIILEIGAHSTLSGPIRSILKDRKLPYVTCLKRKTDAEATMQEAVCELLRQGYAVSLSGVNQYSPTCRYPFLEDLPTYAWNHTTSYWIEPRASREHRFSKMPPHELLGTRVSGDNGYTFLWRNFLRASEIEWLSDHRVESKIVLPGAAYVSMAIEAARLLVDSSEEMVRGYRLRDVDIMNALTISESSAGVEVMLSLKPCSEKELDYKGWYDFELSSQPSGTDAWTLHCKGGVAVEMSNAVRAATATEEKAPEEQAFFTPGAKVRSIDIESFFKNLRDMGIYHGPQFQNFIDSRAANSKAITNLKVTRAAEGQDYVLHPATLDSIIQAAYVDLADQQKKDSMVLPRAIRSMFVPKQLNRQVGEPLRALTELTKTDKRGSTTNISVMNAADSGEKIDSSTEFLQIRDFYVQAVPRDLSDADKGPRVCFKSQWEVDIFNGLPESIRNVMPTSISSVESDYMSKCLKASYYFICDAVAALEKDGPTTRENWAWHHKIYFDWMKEVVQLGIRGELGPGSRAWFKASKGMKQMLIDELSQGSPAKRLLCRVGARIPEIVRGDITPLELMMADNLLNEYYMDVPEFQRLYKHLHKIVDLYAVNIPGAKVLEIGAGTGGATGVVLEGFAARGNGSGTLLGHYTFTDVSSGFFEAARQKFAGWTSLMDFKKLDIEVDPVEQGFEAGGYDIIVASAVLHATKSLNKTMAHVKKLLKPGGKLILLEQTKDRLEAQIVFGTTPGWWLGVEDYRKSSPIATLDVWERVLKEEGFSGIDFDVADLLEKDLLSARVIISSNPTTAKPKFPDTVTVVYTNPPPQDWLNKLTQSIQAATGKCPRVEKFQQATVDDQLTIFVGEMEGPFLDDIDRSGFKKLRNILVASRGVLWLSCSGSGRDGQQALFAEIDGLLRTLRHEDASKRCVHLDFDQLNPWSITQIPHIIHVLKQNFDENVEISDIDGEYKVINDIVHVSRMYPDEKTDNAASKTAIAPPPEMQLFDQPGRVLDWESGKTGVLSEAYFTDDFSFAGGLESGMIEVQPKAFGLNFRDVMVALGQVEEDGLVYSEMCGVVTRLGPSTEQSDLKVGDRVCGAGWGHITNVVRTGWEDVAKLPDNMSFEEAASVPTIYITVYHSLVDIGRLTKGESILIHAGTGGVGQAAIMLAQHIGATIYVTCSSNEKRDFLVERYNIDPSHIFSSRDTTFAPAIMAATNGKGVDVLLNCLSGPLLKAGWECIARFGRFVEIGKVDMQNGRHLDMTAFRRCATISGVDILSLAAYKKDVYRSALKASLKLISDGAVKTVYPLHVYGISEMEKPLRQLQGGKHIGKFVVVPRPGEKVKVVNRPPPVSLDNANSTYLIVGGVTGIGRAAAEWMVQKGAKNLLIVSRNAQSHPDAPSLVQTCKADGCKVEIRNCDVADEASFLSLLQSCKGVLPPIRGVLTTAMVLDDTVLERMTFDQWRHAVLPKVASTMNLHKHLPGLSFFIMMSSTAGIFGNPSQANYNAGNAFQDSLARYRTANGQPAVVIDLGIVESVGFVAEASDEKKQIIETSLKRGGVGAPLALDHLLRLVECSVRHPLRANPDDSQIVTCLAGWDETGEDSALHRDRRFRTLRLGKSFKSGQAAAAADGDKENSSFALTQKLTSPDVGGVTGAARVIADALVGKMADVFNLVASEIDKAMPMSHYGVDSLVAVELRNWLATAAKSKVSVFEILQTPSLMEFAALAAARSDFLRDVAN